MSFGENEFFQDVPEDKLKLFNKNIEESGIETIENQIVILVQKLKDAIIDVVFNDQNTINLKSSFYLSDKLGHGYNYLSGLFFALSFSKNRIHKIPNYQYYNILNQNSFNVELFEYGTFKYTIQKTQRRLPRQHF